MPARTRDATSREALAALDALLARKGAARVAVGAASVALPAPVRAHLRELVAVLARGDAAAVVALREEITTQQAARLLGISRQHVVRLIDAGRLPVRVTRAGRHRRIAATDVLALKAQREAARARAQSLVDEFAEIAAGAPRRNST